MILSFKLKLDKIKYIKEIIEYINNYNWNNIFNFNFCFIIIITVSD